MQVTYISASNTATNGTALGSGEQDVRLFKLLVGAPVNAANITVYSISNPVNGASTNIAAKITLPTFSTTNINPGLFVLDFGPKGLPLSQGGNIVIDQTLQLSAVWGLADDEQKG